VRQPTDRLYRGDANDQDSHSWTLQYLSRYTYTNPRLGGGVLGKGAIDDPENLIGAAIICTIAPILVIYPFLQRFFIHGVLVGAVND